MKLTNEVKQIMSFRVFCEHQDLGLTKKTRGIIRQVQFTVLLEKFITAIVLHGIQVTVFFCQYFVDNVTWNFWITFTFSVM